MLIFKACHLKRNNRLLDFSKSQDKNAFVADTVHEARNNIPVAEAAK